MVRRRIVMRGAWVLVIFLLADLVLAVWTLPSYGLNFDSPIHFLRGQAYLELLTTGRKRFQSPLSPSPVLFVPGQRISQYIFNSWEEPSAPIKPIGEGGKTIQQGFRERGERLGRESFYKHNAWSGEYFMNNEGPGHPPVSDILAAATNRVFYEKLKVVGDVEGYHLYVVLARVLALAVVYYFAYRVWGQGVALLAVFNLALYPLFFAESHFNIKDIPELTFFAGAVVSFYFWVRERGKIWFGLLGLFFFLGLGTKLNILFLPLVVLPWVVSIKRNGAFRQWFGPRLFFYFLLFCGGTLGLLVLSWPYLWSDVLGKLWGIVSFYKEVGSVDLRVSQPSPFLLPLGVDLKGLILFLTTTPGWALMMFLVGSYVLLVKRQWGSLKEEFLLLLWFLIPIARTLRPGAEVFGSTRSFIEFLPAVAIISALGLRYFAQSAARILKINTEVVLAIVTVGYIFYLVLINLRLHPNQNVYFNFLAGGIAGAREKNLFSWQSSYSNPYRQAVFGLNQVAEKDAKLAYLEGTMLAISPVWLRDDIHFGSYFSALEQKGEYIVSLTYPQAPPVFPYLYLERFLRPVLEVKAEGVTLARVWKNSREYLQEGYNNLILLPTVPEVTTGQDGVAGRYWELDLGRERKLVSLKVKIPVAGCQRQDGVFFLKNFFVPSSLYSQNSVEFLFPAEATRRIRFYEIGPNSCLGQGQILEIQVVK